MATSDDTDVANFNAKVNYNISVHMASTLSKLCALWACGMDQ